MGNPKNSKDGGDNAKKRKNEKPSPNSEQQSKKAMASEQMFFSQPCRSSSDYNGYSHFMAPMQGPYSQPLQPVQFSSQGMNNNSTLEDILKRLESIDMRLVKLDEIDRKLSDIDRRVTELDQTVKSINHRVRALEDSRQFDSDSIDEIKNQQAECVSMQTDIDLLKRQSDAHEKQTLDMQTRSMRDNLMFFNIPEPELQKDEREDCTKTVLNFCSEHLKMGDTTDIKLDRAHRVGAFRRGSNRPVVAKFNYYKDRERVRKETKNLKGTNFGVSEQYPKTIQDRRKILLQVKKAETKKERKCVLSVDRLFVDGQLYRGPEVTWD
jgi:chromosome segregation ATPase